MALGSIDNLTILIPPVHEHRLSFHLFVLSSVSFINVLQFSVYRFFTSLVKFISRYFILFDEIVNRIIFLISLSDNTLLVYRNTMDFYTLISYPATFFGGVFRIFYV